MGKLLEGDALEKHARKLGVDISGELITRSASGRSQRAPDFELQQRVTEAERRIRESRMWIFAMVSAIASVLSAAAALVSAAHK
jgi:hypothetical protein